MMRANGSEACPARCCFDLFHDNDDFTDGWYFTDPNLGSNDDAVLTYCSRTEKPEEKIYKTCVDFTAEVSLVASSKLSCS